MNVLVETVDFNNRRVIILSDANLKTKSSAIEFVYRFYLFVHFQSSAKPVSSPFIGIISKCFETHLDIYIESQDR